MYVMDRSEYAQQDFLLNVHLLIKPNNFDHIIAYLALVYKISLTRIQYRKLFEERIKRVELEKYKVKPSFIY